MAAPLPAPPFLCVITDDELSPDHVVVAVESACAAGPVVVQLRARRCGGRELFALAGRLREVTSTNRCLFLVNDRIDVALAVGADGVHLPAAGIPAAVARALLDRHGAQGKGLRLGLSIHSIEEIRGNAPHVDYFQFGPVFATPSKAAYGAPQGFASLVEAVAASAAVGRPLVAVGGINLGNANAVAVAGAAGIAVIRAVMRAPDARAATRALLAEITRRPA